MFNAGEWVQNPKTGTIGKVIGYGHRILSGGYTTTLKVLVDRALSSGKREVVEEDLHSDWVRWLAP
ncbi:MAG: hypothetical protein KME17_23910 [Cyanosarcina radialis HA8281-LM2]|jgi:hypothetical protein|nr:hypothetical protein [Cyanosarcina radialis HA8281-LM2]